MLAAIQARQLGRDMHQVLFGTALLTSFLGGMVALLARRGQQATQPGRLTAEEMEIRALRAEVDQLLAARRLPAGEDRGEE